MPRKKDPNKVPNPPGRPSVDINWKVLDNLCRIHCTKDEIAEVLGVSEDTISRALEREMGMGFAEYYKKRTVRGRASLRRKMWHKAINQDNCTMQIFLSKQPAERGGLGFSDKVTGEGFDGGAGAYEKMMGIAQRLEAKKKAQKTK